MNKINGCFCIVAIIICAGCVNTAPKHQQIAEDNAALIAEIKAENAARKEKQKKEAEQRKILIKNKVDLIIKEKTVNPKDIDYKTYFGSHYRDNRKGEFETKEEYVKRFQSIVDPNKIYYFDLDVELSKYSVKKEQYYLYQPEILHTPPKDWWPPSKYSFKSSSMRSSSYVVPALVRFEQSGISALLWLPLKKEDEKSTYKGQNAYGASTSVAEHYQVSWGLIPIFDKFKNMYSYGYEIDSDFTLLLKIPVEKAKSLNLNSGDVMVRFGIKYSYGVGPIALGHIRNAHKPTLAEPWDSTEDVMGLGVDLDSICFLRRSNMEVISCMVKLDN